MRCLDFINKYDIILVSRNENDSIQEFSKLILHHFKGLADYWIKSGKASNIMEYNNVMVY